MERISISGPVASGKTTLLASVKGALGSLAAFHEEPPERNPFVAD